MCQDKIIEIFYDNKSIVILGKKKNTLFIKRNENVNSGYHSIRECIRKRKKKGLTELCEVH